MIRTLLEKQQAPVVSLERLKRHLRIDGDHEDTALAELEVAATAFLERDCAMALVRQVWRFHWDIDELAKPAMIDLRPIRHVVTVTGYDDNGTPVVLDETRWFLNSSAQPARFCLLGLAVATEFPNGIEADCEVGFGLDGDAVPEDLRMAVIALVSHWFEFRHSHGAAEQPVSIPEAYGRLTASWRRVRL